MDKPTIDQRKRDNPGLVEKEENKLIELIREKVTLEVVEDIKGSFKELQDLVTEGMPIRDAIRELNDLINDDTIDELYQKTLSSRKADLTDLVNEPIHEEIAIEMVNEIRKILT